MFGPDSLAATIHCSWRSASAAACFRGGTATSGAPVTSPRPRRAASTTNSEPASVRQHDGAASELITRPGDEGKQLDEPRRTDTNTEAQAAAGACGRRCCFRPSCERLRRRLRDTRWGRRAVARSARPVPASCIDTAWARRPQPRRIPNHASAFAIACHRHAELRRASAALRDMEHLAREVPALLLLARSDRPRQSQPQAGFGLYFGTNPVLTGVDGVALR